MKKNKTKILHIVWGFENGGIETMLVNILNIQIKSYDVSLLIINNKIDSNLIRRLNREINLIELGRPEGSLNIYFPIKLQLKLIKINAKIIHFHEPGIVKNIFLPKLSKYVCTVHDTKFNHKYLYKYDKILCISNSTLNVCKNFLSKDKLILCYNSIDFDSIKKKVNYNNIKHIAIVGRLIDSHKGQSLLIEALKTMRDSHNIILKCDIIGAGKDHDFFSELIDSYSLNSQVKLLGNLDNTFILRNLYKYDLYIQTSRYEGFGLTALEAIGAKLPIILSAVEGLIEISKDFKKKRLYKNGNSDNLVECILNSIKDFNLLKEECEYNYNSVKTKFSTKIQTDLIDSIYQDLLI